MYNGSGPVLLTHAAGCVTINSTIALSAMHHECPVFVFGDAFYRVPGLVHPGETVEALDRFWAAPQPVDMALFRRFQAHLQRTTQLNGSFYAPSFYTSMSRAVVDVLESVSDMAPPAIPAAAPHASPRGAVRVVTPA